MNDMSGGAELAGAEQLQSWPAGRILFSEGEEPRGIYIVHTGQVDLVFSGRNGMSRTLRSKRSGDVIGLSEVVSNTKHDCTGTTHSASHIGFVPAADLRKLLEENPSLWFGIAARLAVDVGSCWDSRRSLGESRGQPAVLCGGGLQPAEPAR
jgi:CRP-like cAMP-binding protein